MKHFHKIFLLSLVLFLFNQNVFATHAAGGELSYELVPGTTNSYKFTFKFYRDCGAVGQFTSTEPASFILCYNNSCGATTQQVTMPKIVGNIPTNPVVPNGSPLDNGCNSITTCDNINSTIHGYRQWWYSAVVTLPTQCNSWKFWTTLCCRNDITGNITTPPGSQYLYVETLFDNTVSQQNSSPVFINSNSISSLPVPYVCINMPYYHNGGAMDPDGDSLAFELIEPRHKTSCSAVAPVDILLPAYNLTTTNGNPFPTNNSFNLGTTNGFFDFTPNALGYYVLCIKVSEYRNGQLLGSTMRDMQIVVDVCSPLPITSVLDSISIVNGAIVLDTVVTCPGSNLSFCFDIIDGVNTSANVFHLSDDHATVMPGSNVTLTKPANNILRVCVEWISGLNDTGTVRTLSVIVNDSLNCVMTPGIASVPIKVKTILHAGGDTTMCEGDTTASLWAYGNSAVIWNALPGGDGNSSLSCTNCNTPLAWPKKTTSYEVTDVECGYKDTVTVTMLILPAPISSFVMTPKYTTLAEPVFTLKNTSQNALFYTWYDVNHTYLANTVDYKYTANKEGVFCFTLEVENFCGVKHSSTNCGTVVNEGHLVYPTAFTPNGDGKNDWFLPLIIGDMSMSNYYMVIYDRWGTQLFNAKGMKDGWNGQYKGKDCEPGTYFYYAETYTGLNKKLVYKGNVIIVR